MVSLASLSATPTAGSSVNNPIELGNLDKVESLKAWPWDYCTVDITNCFRDNKTLVHGPHKCTAAVIFKDHFPHLTYHHSTFYDNKAIWRNTPQFLRDCYCVIGRNQRGLWSAFTCTVKEAENAQATVMTAATDVIELTDSD